MRKRSKSAQRLCLRQARTNGLRRRVGQKARMGRYETGSLRKQCVEEKTHTSTGANTRLPDAIQLDVFRRDTLQYRVRTVLNCGVLIIITLNLFNDMKPERFARVFRRRSRTGRPRFRQNGTDDDITLTNVQLAAFRFLFCARALWPLHRYFSARHLCRYEFPFFFEIRKKPISLLGIIYF